MTNPFVREPYELWRTQMDYTRNGAITIDVFFEERIRSNGRVLAGDPEKHSRRFATLEELLKALGADEQAKKTIDDFIKLLWEIRDNDLRQGS